MAKVKKQVLKRFSKEELLEYCRKNNTKENAEAMAWIDEGSYTVSKCDLKKKKK